MYKVPTCRWRTSDETERMNLRKKAFLAILMAAVLLLSGCTLIVKDAEVDKKTPIVTVNDKVYTKEEVQLAVDEELYNEYMNYYNYYMYGLTSSMLDTSDPAVIAAAQETAINNLVKKEVQKQKMVAEGLQELTAEEEAKAMENAKADWEAICEEYKTAYLAETELEGDALNEEITKGLEKLGYTLAMFEDNARETVRSDKLREWTIKDVTVSDEEVSSEFDTLVADDQTTYGENANSFASAKNNGSTVYYAPEGVRAIQQILISFTDADKEAISAIRTALSEAGKTASTLEGTLADLGIEDVKTLTERVTVIPANNADTFEAEISDDFAGDESVTEEIASNARELAKVYAEQNFWQDKLASARAAAFAAIDADADAVLVELETGDWDAIAAEKNTDPGMNSQTYKENKGYLVCEGMTSFDAPFVKAAMALTEKGQISPKTACGDNLDYGYYILKYVDDVTPGAVEMTDAIAADIHDKLLADKQDKTYETAVETWIGEAKVKIDKAALAN